METDDIRRPGVELPAGPAGRGSAPLRPRRLRRNGVTPRVLPYGLVIPALLVVALVSVFPITHAVRTSLYRTRFLELEEPAGFSHYADIFLSAGGRADLMRSLVYVGASLALVIPLGLLLASMLNQPVRFRSMFRVILLLPWVVSQTIAALLWRWLLNPDYGPISLALGGGRVDLLAEPGTAMAALILVNIWVSYPLATILSLAALQTVGPDLLESARVDGAGPWQTFTRIVIPLIRPTLMVLAIMLTLLYFNMVTLVLTFTGGGPFSGTQVLSLTAFTQSFHFFNIGLGSAYAVVLFVFNIIFAVAYVRVLRTDPHA